MAAEDVTTSRYSKKGEAPGKGEEYGVAGNERDIQSPREWPANEIVYIIVAHGGGNDGSPWVWGHNYPTGHTHYIPGPVEFWKKYNFGVLVSERAVLACGIVQEAVETLQNSAKRHVNGIINGTIKLYQRFPWKYQPGMYKESVAGLGYFPNLVFTEGGGWNQSGKAPTKNPFIATIVKHYNGITTYFHLSKSVNEGTLLEFEKPHEYPSNILNDIPAGTPTLLSEILILLEKDKSTEMVREKLTEKPKAHVIFATCMSDIDPSIDLKWKPSLTGECGREIITGGKRKKNKFKRRKSRRKISRRKISRRKISRTRKR